MTSFLVTDEQLGRIAKKQADLFRRVREGSLNPETVLVALQPIIEGGAGQVTDRLLVGYQRFCREVFGLETNLSKVVVPNQRSGFDQLLVVAQGLTIGRVLEVCRQNFPVDCYLDNPDEQIVKNDRSPDKASYAIWVRDRIEADEELKNRSANQLRDDKVPIETLLERLLHELKYWYETGGKNNGQHLDIQNWTLCAGSRGRSGDVPHVAWHDGRLCVYWCGPGAADPDLRARSVVSSSESS